MKDCSGFVMDEMLWKLGRFLRIAGFDVSIPRPTNDDQLARISREEDRILLTRDKDLSNRKDANSFRIISDDLKEQIRELSEGLRIKEMKRSGSRCPTCGGILKTVKKKDLKEGEISMIPAGVLSFQDTYYICTGCGRIFWRGSHWEGITNILKDDDLLPDLQF